LADEDSYNPTLVDEDSYNPSLVDEDSYNPSLVDEDSYNPSLVDEDSYNPTAPFNPNETVPLASMGAQYLGGQDSTVGKQPRFVNYRSRVRVLLSMRCFNFWFGPLARLDLTPNC